MKGHSRCLAAILTASVACAHRSAWQADLASGIEDYLETRSAAVRQTGAVVPAATGTALTRERDQLAAMIQAFRKGAIDGVLIPPRAGNHIRENLARRFQQPDGTDLRAALTEVQPMRFMPVVNGRYPGDEPRATVPPSVLEVLPPLPPVLEYRFVGRDLLLLDRNTGVIVDILRDALPSR